MEADFGPTEFAGGFDVKSSAPPILDCFERCFKNFSDKEQLEQRLCHCCHAPIFLVLFRGRRRGVSCLVLGQIGWERRGCAA